MDNNEEKMLDCKNDIEILETGKGYLETLIRQNQEVTEKLNSIAIFCESAFTADNIDELKQEQKNLNETFTDTLLTLKGNIEKEIMFLEDELQKLGNMDK